MAPPTSDERAYLTGGATAVLFGWRETTIDVDLALVREADSVLRELPRLQDELQALALFGEIELELYRFPAVDPPSFRARVERAFA